MAQAYTSSADSIVEECLEAARPAFENMVRNTCQHVIERLAEDYGLSHQNLQERYLNGGKLKVRTKAYGAKGKNDLKNNMSTTPKTYVALDKVLEETNAILKDMQQLDIASDELMNTNEEGDEVQVVGQSLKKVLLDTDRKIVEMSKHIKYLANTLHSVFPPKVVEALKSELSDIADLHPSVTVLMCDIVGFTAWCADAPPTQVIECLSAYFQVIDDLAEQIGVYKVETIGDGYQAICGHNNEEDHMVRMATFAIAIIDTIPQMQRIFKNTFSVRVGLNSGPIVTGVIRADRPRWQLFGDTVNYASRMESTSEPGKIQISRTTYDLLNLTSKFDIEKRGLIQVKGKGEQQTFWLKGRKEEQQSFRPTHGMVPNYKPLHEPEIHENGKPTVLIVDDMLSIVLQLSRTLKKFGANVVTARNGKDALDILKQRTFHAVLSDIHMPIMGGMEFVKNFRAWEAEHRANAHQKIYALTGTVREDEGPEVFINAGFDSKLSKTASKEDIISLVFNSN